MERIKKLHDSRMMLEEFNQFAFDSFLKIHKDYEKHTKTVQEMRMDIENVFKRIRALKQLISTNFPQPPKEPTNEGEKDAEGKDAEGN